MAEKAKTPIDPSIRGIVCCLMDLEQEALSLGQNLAANLIAAAHLALANRDAPAVNDNPGLPIAIMGGRSAIRLNERQGIAGG